MFVHKRGQILANLRNQLIEFKHVDHIVETELNIKVKKFISTPNTKCLDELITFDSCVKKSIIHQLQGQCLHLFWNQPENSSSCNNSTSNQAALNIFQTSSKNCLTPCTQVIVDIKLNPINWIQTFLNPWNDKNFVPGYLIKIPSTILYSELQGSYTTISFIAEFGAWVGLFLGVSVLGAFEFLEKLIISKCNRFAKLFISTSFMLLKLICILGMFIILVKCFQKLINMDKTMDIFLEKGLPNISISLCSYENLYEVELNHINKTYLGNSTDFWNNITKLSDKIERMELILETEKSVVIYDERFNRSSEYMSYSINTPQFETFIETCHTLDLNQWNRIMKMKVIAKKELIIYVHITGQLLRPGRQGFTFVNTDTVTLYT